MKNISGRNIPTISPWINKRKNINNRLCSGSYLIICKQIGGEIQFGVKIKDQMIKCILINEFSNRADFLS